MRVKATYVVEETKSVMVDIPIDERYSKDRFYDQAFRWVDMNYRPPFEAKYLKEVHLFKDPKENTPDRWHNSLQVITSMIRRKFLMSDVLREAMSAWCHVEVDDYDDEEVFFRASFGSNDGVKSWTVERKGRLDWIHFWDEELSYEDIYEEIRWE
jgi:hypothetical protein